MQTFSFGKEVIEHYLRPEEKSLISDYSRDKIAILNAEIRKKHTDFLAKSYVDDSITFYVHLNQLSQRDSANYDSVSIAKIERRFLNFLVCEGTPPDLLIFGEIYIMLLIQISDEELYKAYQTFLYSQLVKGNLNPRDYGMFVDSWIDA